MIKTVTNQECKVAFSERKNDAEAFSERKNAEADAYALTRNESNLLALRLAPTEVVTMYNCHVCINSLQFQMKTRTGVLADNVIIVAEWLTTSLHAHIHVEL